MWRKIGSGMSKPVNQCEVMWVALEDRGFEHLLLSISDTGVNADGIIVRRDNDGNTYRAHYTIECDPAWGVRHVEITKRLTLTSDGQGHWLDSSGHPLPALDGCFDIDILASPFTNTLAIRRLHLDVGASATIDIVFIDPRNGQFHCSTQRYTRLSDANYHYASLESGFESELPVDDDGLLIEYPGYFRRAWSR
jgi:hypothetical protein